MSGKRTKAIREEYRKLPLNQRGKRLYFDERGTLCGNSWRVFKRQAIREGRAA